MAESSNSIKDTELTMCDVLQEEQELEEDANAVLGGSDDTNCSYDEGYVPRQALYACKTCKIEGEAGVCLACCYACHDGHEVVELYTKRNFRCDCGNSKFLDKKCTLRSDKEPVNTRNIYNHNFKGLYCSCSRPYPDLEDDTPDEMIQCVLCEDWYHGRHLGVGVPEDYFEMICEQCMQSHRFLYSYLNKCNVIVDVGDTIKKEANRKSPRKCNGVSETKATVDVKAEKLTEDMAPSGSAVNMVKDLASPLQDANGKPSNDVASGSAMEMEVEAKPVGINVERANEVKSQPSVPVIDEPVQNGDVKEATETCLLESLDANAISAGSGFWPESWRKELCRCSKCMIMYAESKCEFLLDSSDTIQAYEERGKGRSGQSQYDKGLSALGQLDRVKQMEAVRAYTSMKGQLKEYLKEFADSKRTVCESDIKEFFERIGKKQKLNNGVPHFCR